MGRQGLKRGTTAALLLCACMLSGCGAEAPAPLSPSPAPTAEATAAPTPVVTPTPAPAPTATEVPATETPTADGPDYLVLVNAAHPIDPAYIESVTLAEVTGADGGTYEAEERTLDAFFALRDALAERGVTVAVESAYRSVERQRELMDAFIEYYGEDYARSIAAEPGTSEHHTGLAIDLVPWIDGAWARADADEGKKAAVYAVIHGLLPEFGFILRYPADKEEITGYDYEPWHIRYVGSADTAREIYEQGLTLEEYPAR